MGGCADPHLTDGKPASLRGKVTRRQGQCQDWAQLASSRIYDGNYCLIQPLSTGSPGDTACKVMGQDSLFPFLQFLAQLGYSPSLFPSEKSCSELCHEMAELNCQMLS